MIKDITGLRFGSLVALNFDHIGNNKNAYWRYRCDCGKEVILRANTITYQAKHSKKPQFPSCGCKELEQKTKHGFRKAKDTHPLYKAYKGMMLRCYSKTCPEYKWYGAVGVTVCDKWRGHPEVFCKWGLEHGWFKGSHIDKDILCEKLNIHPHIYSPETCQFTTPKRNVSFASNRNNFGKHPNVRLSFDDVDQIIKLYQEGLSAPKIIELNKFNIKSPSSIYRLLKLAGIPRKRNEHKS